MSLDFNTWDNFEFFTPIIWESHSHWLKGELPLLNPFQHGGTSLAANIQAGVFYPIYTLAVALVKLTGASPLALMNWITGIHFAIFAAALYLLCRSVGAARYLAASLTLGGAASGFALGYAAIWVYMPASLAWFTLGLWAVLSASWGRLTLACAMLGLIGQPQMWVYALVAWSAFIVLRVRAPGMPKAALGLRGLTAPALGLVSGIWFAAPAWLTSFPLLGESSRSEPLALFEFQQFSLTKSSLYGVLAPFFPINDGVLFTSQSLLLWQGPGVALGLVFALFKFHEFSREQKNLIRVSGLVSILFICFGLGANFFVYRFTYGVPLWSSFRWPFKFAAIFLPLLTLVSALALTQFDLLKKNWIAQLLLALSLLSAGYAFFAAQNASPKTYAAKDSGLRDARETFKALDPRYYALPVSTVAPTEASIFLFGLYNTASLTGLHSITGSNHPFMPKHLVDSLSLNRVDGLLHERDLDQKLADGTLRSLGVRYYLMQNTDVASRARLTQAGLRSFLKHGPLEIFEDERAVLPASREASEVPAGLSVALFCALMTGAAWSLFKGTNFSRIGKKKIP